MISNQILRNLIAELVENTVYIIRTGLQYYNITVLLRLSIRLKCKYYKSMSLVALLVPNV